MKPDHVLFFETAADLHTWLEVNHESASHAWIGFAKKASGRTCVGYPEAVDEALCHGWIDGQLSGLDETTYALRFTPRRKGSNWSAANVRRVAELRAAGRMRPAGLQAFEARRPERTAQYSYENRPNELPDHFAADFRAHPAAWQFFCAAPPSYRRTMTWWIVSAKRPETRERRLRALVDASAQGRRLDQMNLPAVSRR